jgi:hypothetical protein
MCRNIKPLYNFERPASDADVQVAALQFVRKISGFNKPSKANEQAFEAAVEATTQVAQKLLAELVTSAPVGTQTTGELITWFTVIVEEPEIVRRLIRCL